jgi:benzoyl-CoA-dihydrodiol lyase
MHLIGTVDPPEEGSMAPRIDFQTEPARYRHWRLAFEGEVATLTMDVDEDGGLFAGYQLKLNSYDLGVDIELADAVQRLRFEHPEVKVVVLRSGKDRVFCAGANIRMLAGATHAHKVNFCKFTNETRNAMEDASGASGQKYMCAVRGTAAGGGYELALATDHILLADDGNSTVALPELPLLAVLPGTGGLTRVTDKRKVRRDLADAFCTVEEGVKGERAVAWRLVDQAVPTTQFERAVREAAAGLAAQSDRPGGHARGIRLTELERALADDAVAYSSLKVAIDRAGRRATLTLEGPRQPPPASAAAMEIEGAAFWPLRLARELDDAILHLRLNEPQIGVLIFRSEGDGACVLAHDAFLAANGNHWLAREILLYWKRVLKRVDVTSRSLVAMIEPGGCFAGTLAELALACDRSFMLIGGQGGNRSPSCVALSALNFGAYPMANGLSRLATRFLGEPARLDALKREIGKPLAADACDELGLVTSTLDDIDWHDEVRIFLEERASFSADGLTGMEANLRFAGPETMESKIFGRLSAWQNWIFQRPNAAGAEGALTRYGSGVKAKFNPERV